MYANNLKDLSIKSRKKVISLLGLPKRLEQVLMLRYVEELDAYQIAEIMCIDTDSVDNLVTKARKKFNSILENEYKLHTNEDKEYLDLVRK